MNRRITTAILFLLVLAACTDTPPAPKMEPRFAVSVTQGYAQRRSAYLEYCNDNHGPGMGGIHGQVCRVYKGETTYHEETIRKSLARIDRREDTSDFHLNSLLRMLWLDRTRQVLPADLRLEIETTVLNFKYWLTEPGPDTMVWWSENHQVLFHTAEILAGQLFPDTQFTNSGMTGREHIARATPDLLRWMNYRARFGFSEFHSNVYFNEDMPPLVNIVDFAWNEELRAKAAIVLDIIFFDMASNYFAGRFATAHGRTYPGGLLNGLNDSTREAAYIGLGNVPVTSVTEMEAGNFTAAHMATSEHYAVPEILERIASHAPAELEHRQRDGIDIADGPGYGISYTEWQDIVFWWGMTGYIAPEIISGTFALIDYYRMWEGAEWEDLQFIQPLVGTSVLRTASEAFAPMSRGIALESANVYTYRTPHYQLSGAQSYKPSSWTGQVHVWQATFDEKAYVFTTYPGGSSGNYMATAWTGGFVPRATFYKSVGIIQYRRPSLPGVEKLLTAVEDAGYGLDFVDLTHAYFPKKEFDEVVTSSTWTIARKGDAYIGLWSEHPVTWSTTNDYELIAEARENIWIVEMGDKASHGSFANFAAALQAAKIDVENGVRYDSPHRGRYEVGWTGNLTVDGAIIDLGPYKRWDNVFAQQEFNTTTSEIGFEGRRLNLDFGAARRIESSD